MPGKQTHRANSLFTDPLAPQNPLVARRWVVIALLTSLLSAVVLGYGCLVLLVWQGQWQILFHPSHVVARTPAALGLTFEEVRFDTTETGQPLLAGWWVPAAKPAVLSVLLIHGASGSVADTVDAVAALHRVGFNVFSYDPRGFGKSAWAKPSERRLQEDAGAAFAYLTGTRHLVPSSVVLCGEGLGASVAAVLAAGEPGIRALVLVNPQTPVLPLLLADPRANLVPLRFITHDRFDPAPALASDRVPKLFIATAERGRPVPFFAEAALPKMLVEAPESGEPLEAAAVQTALQRLIAAAH